MLDNSNPHRLSELVVPENYKIILEPNLNEHTFNGEVNINIDVINYKGNWHIYRNAK